MKIAFGFVLVFMATANAIQWRNCNSRSLIQIDTISPASGTLDRNTKLDVKATSTSTYTDNSMKALVEVKVTRLGLIDITLPNVIYSMLSSTISNMVPGVSHVSGNVFEVGCDASTKFLPSCPPKQGPIVLPTIDLGPIFKAIYSKIGFLVFVGNGNYEVEAKVSIKGTGESLLCLDIQKVSVKIN